MLRETNRRRSARQRAMRWLLPLCGLTTALTACVERHSQLVQSEEPWNEGPYRIVNPLNDGRIQEEYQLGYGENNYVLGYLRVPLAFDPSSFHPYNHTFMLDSMGSAKPYRNHQVFRIRDSRKLYIPFGADRWNFPIMELYTEGGAIGWRIADDYNNDAKKFEIVGYFKSDRPDDDILRENDRFRIRSVKYGKYLSNSVAQNIVYLTDDLSLATLFRMDGPPTFRPFQESFTYDCPYSPYGCGTNVYNLHREFYGVCRVGLNNGTVHWELIREKERLEIWGPSNKHSVGTVVVTWAATGSSCP